MRPTLQMIRICHFSAFVVEIYVLDISYGRMMPLMDEMGMPHVMTKFSERMLSQTSTIGCYLHTKIDITRQMFINKMM